jgi:FkbM family methyltransferase
MFLNYLLRLGRAPMHARDTFMYLREELRYKLLVLSNPEMYSYHGIEIPLRATSQLQSIRRSIYRGDYEFPEIQALSGLIKPDDVVLELGSGCGIVSAIIAKKLSDSRMLHTVEANPQLIPSIKEIARLNKLEFNVVNAAVGTSDGEIEFFFDEHFFSSSIYDRGRSARKMKVPVVSLSELVERIQPTVIVFDVEGAEHEVLSGRISDSVRVLCGELHPHIIGDQKVTNIIRNIIGQGFDLHLDYSVARSVAFSRTREASITNHTSMVGDHLDHPAQTMSVAAKHDLALEVALPKSSI